MRQAILCHIQDHADDVKIDAMGNLLATRRGTGRRRLRVMVAAHMDEVGFMVTGHDTDGLLKFRAVGGVHPTVTPGNRVVVGPKKLPGVIGMTPIHLASGAGFGKVVETSALRIDIGVSTKDQAKRKAPLGTYATFDTKFSALGPTVRGKALDDRGGCAILIDLFTGDPFPFDLLAAFTVQEEVGLRGAQVAGYALEPDVAFVLEGTVCNDVPQEPDEDRTPVTRLGHGPAISVMDRSMIADRRLVAHLIATAKAHGIPHQLKAPGSGGTDAGAIHLSRAGVPSAVVSVPCRYIHSPAAIMSLADFENATRLTREALRSLKPSILESER
ncbi:MAG: M20/M25/M40 family metallo-hydrolase [Anaerolineae bacterium]|nr:M20/M25/M40 family metallo-hydrolase [Anaerolineae bacterium]